MSLSIVKRTDYGLPAKVYNRDGQTERRKLDKRLSLVIVHYTGVNRSFKSVLPETIIKSVHYNHMPNEYNYVIALDGSIYEWAGEYQAAHCKGYNTTAHGVLFLNGTQDACSDKQVVSFKWLIDIMRWVRLIADKPKIAKHSDIARTQCPGIVADRWNELVISHNK